MRMSAPATRTDRSADIPAIALDNASFGYAGRPFTEGVTLSIPQGQAIALLGPNGSGKSTLVRGLLGLNDHVAGTVQVLGTPLDHLRDRSRLGYVPQRHTLSGSVRSTVREVIATGQLAGRPWYRRATAQDRAAAARAAETVGLADRLDADVATLSGGQQRRVLIARALAARPEVLIMDEPTAGVDATSQEVLATVLRRLAGLGVTMLVVTHELAALRGIVDRIVAMDTGQVAFDGTPREYAVHQAEASLAADAHPHEEGPPLDGGLFSGAGPMDGPVDGRHP